MSKRERGRRDEAWWSGERELLHLRRRLLQALAALVAVTLLGIVGFAVIGRGEHGLVDAVYMTVITLTTVGFNEVIDLSENPAGRVFTIILLLGGMGIVAYAVPMVAAFFIEGQLQNIFARRRMHKTISRLNDHYIVCGDNVVTWHVLDELVRTRREAVLIVPDEATFEEARRRLGDMIALVGDPTTNAVLLEAGIERAAGVVVCMRDVKDNVLAVLTARRLAPDQRVVAATEHDEATDKLRMAGADVVVSPYRVGGLRMASELIRPGVVTFLDQMLRDDRGSLRVEELVIPAQVSTEGRTLGSLEIDNVDGALLLAVRPPGGAFAFKPSPSTRLEPGMGIVVMADAEGRMRLEARIQERTGA